MSFSDDLKKEADNVIKAQREIHSVIAIELFSGVITSSPVGNPSLWKNPNSAPDGYTGGSFRSNWYLTETVESVKYSSGRNADESSLISGITKRITGKYSSKWILTNNAPYGERLESGNWSKQSPNGIIDPNVMRVSSKIPAIEKIVNKKYGVD
ncbi:neck protein [Vibrio phage 1.082.O._10N.261.49.E4]|nr:neck protein [Vibrio phage 1.082.O._10N.261.49.E4]AUR90600.1 neck protein [Vibrio phage 1.148.O._10N.286.54.A10]